MTDTTFYEKLKNHPIAKQTKLYLSAIAALRRHNGNAFQAQRTIANAIEFDLLAIKELCGNDLRELIERKAFVYAQNVKRDQSGDALRNEAGHRTVADDGQNRSASASFRQPIWTPTDIAPVSKADREREGQALGASNGFDLPAKPARDTKSTNDGERGQSSGAQGLCKSAPSPSPEITGRGHGNLAANGQTGSAPCRGTRFTPGHARRGAAAIASVQPVMAKTLLDTWTVRDGRIVGDLMLKDLAGLVASNRKEAAVLDKIRNHSANGDPSQLVREIISAESLERFISEAEEVSRAA